MPALRSRTNRQEWAVYAPIALACTIIITRRSWARVSMFLALPSGQLCTEINARWCRCTYQASWLSP